MKKILFLALLIGSILPLSAQQQYEDILITARGTVNESIPMPSKILGEDVNYSVYLPPDYSESNRKYPLLYLLHGNGGDERDWIQWGEINIAADRLISSGKIAPMIIIIPSCKTFIYENDRENKYRYEDFFIEEFIPNIERAYRIRSEKAYRAISGLSAGGKGTLFLAMRHPDYFVAAVPFSPGIETEKQINSAPQGLYNNLLRPFYGEGRDSSTRLNDFWESHSPYFMAMRLPVEQLSQVKWYLDSGDDDIRSGITQASGALHELWIERGVPYEYRVRDGAHTWSYWRSGFYNGLIFINEAFHR